MNNTFSIEIPKSIFFNESAQMLKVVNDHKECNWKTVWTSLYKKSKNFDIFKDMIRRDYICMTEKSRNLKNKCGTTKYLWNSLSDGAMYECAPLGKFVCDTISTCSNAFSFVANAKHWQHEIKSGMSKYEFLMLCSISGSSEVFTDEFLNEKIMPELTTTQLGIAIHDSFLRRRAKFFSKFNT